MKFIGIIPAHLKSKRFPQKLLKDVLGKPLIQRTYENALICPILDEIYIATDSDLIADLALTFSAKVIHTKACSNGTERITKAAETLQEISMNDVIVNIQGDHPCVLASTISAILKPFSNKDVQVTTPVMQITDLKKINSPNVVKCVFDNNSKALYFSRSAIPYNAESCYQHLGIYAYRKQFLLKLQKLEDTKLQLKEDLEQLKILENGYPIHTVVVNDVDIAIDHPSDLINLKKYLCTQNISL